MATSKSGGDQYDIFRRHADARPTSGGKFIPPGQHRFVIDAVKYIPDGFNGKSFVVELETKESTSPDAVAARDRLAPGQSCSWVINLSKAKYPELAVGNIKQFLLACFPDTDPTSLDDPDRLVAVIDRISGDDNPLGGSEIFCEGWNKPTREGKDFTRVKWSPVEEAAPSGSAA